MKIFGYSETHSDDGGVYANGKVRLVDSELILVILDVLEKLTVKHESMLGYAWRAVIEAQYFFDSARKEFKGRWIFDAGDEKGAAVWAASKIATLKDEEIYVTRPMGVEEIMRLLEKRGYGDRSGADDIRQCKTYEEIPKDCIDWLADGGPGIVAAYGGIKIPFERMFIHHKQGDMIQDYGYLYIAFSGTSSQMQDYDAYFAVAIFKEIKKFVELQKRRRIIFTTSWGIEQDAVINFWMNALDV